MTLLSPRREVGEFKKRYKWMALVAVIVFGLLASRMVQLQLVDHGRWSRIAEENITKLVVMPATRGILRDTKGRIIATNRPSYSVFITPQLLHVDRDVPRIEELMQLDAAGRKAFRERLASIPTWRRTHQIELFSDITRDQLASLETHSNELPGVDVIAVPTRFYPFGTLGAHALGYLNEVSAEDLERLKSQSYQAGDVVGRSGIERAWESFLRGRRGFRRVLVDVRGRMQEVPSSKRNNTWEWQRDPVPGRDLTLTFDMELMRSLDRAFRPHPSGAAVVVDVRTGRVRALYSKPAYDVNEMSGRLSANRFNEMKNDPFRPLIDKTLYESYFPGSTFKPISALAALGDGLMDPAQRIQCTGSYELGNRRFRCTMAHGEVDMRRALVQSCNVYFYKLAEQVGLDRLARYANLFGLGRPTGVGINTETSGFIPTKEWYVRTYGSRFRLGFTLNAAIGQGNTRATLLQIAMAYAAIANGGTLHVPQLVERVSAPNGTVIDEFMPRVRRKLQVDPSHLAYVADALYGGVNEEEGTAYVSRGGGRITIAGKTGTAQVSHAGPKQGEDPRRAWYLGRDHAWFAGFAPAEDPEVVIVVLVEHGGAGGKTAAPIAITALEEYLGGPTTSASAEVPPKTQPLAARSAPSVPSTRQR